MTLKAANMRNLVKNGYCAFEPRPNLDCDPGVLPNYNAELSIKQGKT